MSILATISDLLPKITLESILLLGAYGSLGFIYLVLVPLGLFYWMNRRWHQMGKIERLGIYGMVFLFFPGMIVFAPFLNLRLRGQGSTEL